MGSSNKNGLSQNLTFIQVKLVQIPIFEVTLAIGSKAICSANSFVSTKDRFSISFTFKI